MGACEGKPDDARGQYTRGSFLEEVCDDDIKKQQYATEQLDPGINAEASLVEDEPVVSSQPIADSQDCSTDAAGDNTAIDVSSVFHTRRRRKSSVLDAIFNQEDEKEFTRVFWALDGVVRSEKLLKPHTPIVELRHVIKLDRTGLVRPLQNLYIIQIRWIKRWLMFAVYGQITPGPITNEFLVNNDLGRLRKSCKYNGKSTSGWRAVNTEVWNYLLSQYGGGPAIAIKIPEHVHDDEERRACQEQQGKIIEFKERLRRATIEREDSIKSRRQPPESRETRLKREAQERIILERLNSELRIRNRAKQMVTIRWLETLDVHTEAFNSPNNPMPPWKAASKRRRRSSIFDLV